MNSISTELQTVAGTFASVVDAERALEALRALDIPPDRVSMVMGESKAVALGRQTTDDTALEPASIQHSVPKTNVGGGAATGATLGGIVGILWGWISGSVPAAVPGAVASVSSGILSSTITGLAIGAAVGGLVGALVGVGMPEIAAPEGESAAQGHEHSRRIVVTIQASGLEADRARETLLAQGATDVTGDLSEGSRQQAESSIESTVYALGNTDNSQSEIQNPQLEGVTAMADDELMGRDPNSVTGTKDAIDPETGALGTAGTPMTTGYGVSGSTIGTGSARGQSEQESGDFQGAMPDTDSYAKGGRGATDAPDRGTAHDTPVEEKHDDLRSDEAPVQSEPETRDVYEGGPSYGTPVERPLADTAATDYYSSSDVDAPPTDGNIEMDSTQESEGTNDTNIPVTPNPRGLGDNTDS